MDTGGVLVVGESKSRVANPREGRRANAMLTVELIVICVEPRLPPRAPLSHRRDIVRDCPVQPIRTHGISTHVVVI